MVRAHWTKAAAERLAPSPLTEWSKFRRAPSQVGSFSIYDRAAVPIKRSARSKTIASMGLKLHPIIFLKKTHVNNLSG